MTDRRRSTTQLMTHGFIFCACALGCIRSTIALDSYKGNEKPLVTFFMEESKQVVRTLTVPPQPRDKRGNLVCTKDRYVKDEQQSGVASWYGNEFHGGTTASGERFDENANTLAHLTLPMGTEVLVENPDNGEKFHARVNDCGPFVVGRIADLSKGLAKKLSIMKSGTGTVIITVL